MKRKIIGLGVMTGTSCDGIDLSLMEFRPRANANDPDFRPLSFKHGGYPKPLRNRIMAIQSGRPFSIKDLLQLDRDVGKWIGRECHKWIRKTGGSVDFIASHGQTIAHFPFDRPHGVTLQIGNAADIVNETGISVVSDFRSGDLASGGQGAPLVPLFHQAFFRKSQSLILNIGGIANFTYLGARGDILASDTGPGNIWIDRSVQLVTKGKKSFDFAGSIASRGKPDLAAIKKILKLPYFKRRAPKSTGRDDFPFEILIRATRARGQDLVATATGFTAHSIAKEVRSSILAKGLKISEVLVCGGGAKNKALLRDIEKLLGYAIPVRPLNNESQKIESMAFAYLGYLSIGGLPLGGAWTGSRRFGSPGKISPGKNWLQLISKLPKS